MTITANRPTRVGMISLGCPKNLVDSEIMLGQLREESEVEITTISMRRTSSSSTPAASSTRPSRSRSTRSSRSPSARARGCSGWSSPAAWCRSTAPICSRPFRRSTAFVGLDHLEQITAAVTGGVDDAAPVKRKMSVRLYEDLPRVLAQGNGARVSEGVRGLLESVHVLRDPADARQVPQPRRSTRSFAKRSRSRRRA